MLPDRPRPSHPTRTSASLCPHQGHPSYIFLCWLLSLTSVLSVPLKVSVPTYVELYTKSCSPDHNKGKTQLLPSFLTTNSTSPSASSSHITVLCECGKKCQVEERRKERFLSGLSSFPYSLLFIHATSLGIGLITPHPYLTTEASQGPGRLTVRAAVFPSMGW